MSKKKRKGRMPAALARYWASRRSGHGGGHRKRGGHGKSRSRGTTIVLAGSGVGRRRRRGGGSRRRGFLSAGLIPSKGTMIKVGLAGAAALGGFYGVEKLQEKLTDNFQEKNPGQELPFYLAPGYKRAATKAGLGLLIVGVGGKYIGYERAMYAAAGILVSAGLDALDAYNDRSTTTNRVAGSCQGGRVGDSYQPQLPDSSGLQYSDPRRLAMTA